MEPSTAAAFTCGVVELSLKQGENVMVVRCAFEAKR